VEVGDSWFGALTERHRVRATLTAVIPGRGTGTAMTRISGPDRPAFVTALVGADEVVAAREIETGSDPAVVTFETDEPFLQAPVRTAGIPFEPPMPVENGVADLTVTAGNDRLERLTDTLAEAGYDYTVDAVYSSVAAAGPLTDRQQTVLAAAVEAGYYETPRAVSLTELADRLGVGKAALSETLRRAEGALAERFLEGRSVGDLDEVG
jgi:predicted DNA binding protein